MPSQYFLVWHCFSEQKTIWRLQSSLVLLQEFDRPNSAYMLFYERAESLEPVPPTAGSGPHSHDISSSGDPVVQLEHDADQKSQQVAPAQSQQAPTDADELMPPASPQAMQEPPAASATSPIVLAQLANVSPLKVHCFCSP